MPKLGFNLLVWTAAISDEWFPHIERLKKIGYDGIEICNGSQDPAAYKRLDKLARDLGPRPHADNAVDLAGYAACLAECQASAPPADGGT